jgi:quinolinate synthase
MLKEVCKSIAERFIIVTKIRLVDRLRSNFPTKTFIPALMDAMCVEQKEITIYNLIMSLLHEQHQIRIPPSIASKARLTIERMQNFQNC